MNEHVPARTIHIAHTRYTIKTTASQESIDKAIHVVEETLRLLQSKMPTMSTHHISILTAFHIAVEYMHSKDALQHSLLEEQELCKKIDAFLENSGISLK